MNNFNMVKKPRGLGGVIAVFIVIGIIGVFVEAKANNPSTQKTIDNIALLQAGNSYAVEDGKFIIKYGKGKSLGVVPLDPGASDPTSFFTDKAVYISDEVTTVAYGGIDAENAVKVLTSGDKGKTWNSSWVADAGTDHAETKFIGFTSKNDGWLVTLSDVASGHQKNRIFQTSDGGNTWSEVGNTNEIYAHVVTGAGFADQNIGFLSFRYDSDTNPVVYRTQDKGKTWVKCSVELPEKLKTSAAYPTAMSPVFNGANGILPVTLTNNNTGIDTQIQYATADYGKSWMYDNQ
nr:sialidase family protein [uncultured Caproiciproducens sp.]